MFVAVRHLVDGLCLEIMLTIRVEKIPGRPAGTRKSLIVHELILFLETLIESRGCSLEYKNLMSK
jgi:hypothetical protein